MREGRVASIRSSGMAVAYRSRLRIGETITKQNLLIALACQSNQGQVLALNSWVHVIFIESSKFKEWQRRRLIFRVLNC